MTSLMDKSQWIQVCYPHLLNFDIFFWMGIWMSVMIYLPYLYVHKRSNLSIWASWSELAGALLILQMPSGEGVLIREEVWRRSRELARGREEPWSMGCGACRLERGEGGGRRGWMSLGRNVLLLLRHISQHPKPPGESYYWQPRAEEFNSICFTSLQLVSVCGSDYYIICRECIS